MMTLFVKVDRIRLVDDEGIIPQDAFYNYLSAWIAQDPLAYAASQADIRPSPVSWKHDRESMDMIIPRSESIIYSQLPYYLNGTYIRI